MMSGGDDILSLTAVPAIDEMVDGGGRIRSHWQAVAGGICSLPSELMDERMERIRRHLEESGIGPVSGGQPVDWRLDPVPVILPAEEWEQLAAGLRQRAHLHNGLLADIYGPQHLLSTGILPPALIQGNPRFLRPACHVLPAGRRHLHVYAADLVRGPQGHWQVVSERIDAPAGLGLAQENRQMLSRAMPEIFRMAPVRRLKPFFELWQQSLLSRAPAHHDNPRMGLLTPGPLSETWGDQVSLARELNLMLVEGADLTVRNGRAYLKTLSGLHPVDLLLRRIDSEFVDPLELRPDSVLGATGLLQAVRSGVVEMANAVGCGVLETPALAAFLPALARSLLDGELLLPSLETWWCGQSSRRREALAALQERPQDFLVRRTFPWEPGGGRAMDPAAPAVDGCLSVIQEIERMPAHFVVQERPCPSLTPTWVDGRLVPRPLVIRLFVVADGEDYTVLPGGFARVGADEAFGGLDSFSLTQGGTCKDVWVLADAEGDTVVPAPPPAPPLILRRSAGELPSRLADNLYWLGRYAERADNAARLLRSALGRLAEGNLGPRERVELGMLSGVLSERGWLDRPTPASLVDGPSLGGALTRACSEGQPLWRLLESIGRMVPGVRDRLSPDLLHILGPRLEQARQRLPVARRDIDGALESLDGLVIILAALGGMVAENMTRHAGWRFLDMGRKLERAQFTLGCLRGVASRVKPGPIEPGLRLALELCDSSITYRTRYRSVLQPAAVLDLVLADQGNPRSLAHQIGRLLEHLAALPGSDGQPASQAGERLAHAAMAVVWRLELELSSGSSRVERLDSALSTVEGHLAALNDALTRTFFSHIKAAQSLGYGRVGTGDGYGRGSGDEGGV